jgi:hypothetical protein
MTFALMAFLIIFLLCTGVLWFGDKLSPHRGNATSGSIGIALIIALVWLVSGIGLAATIILKLSC